MRVNISYSVELDEVPQVTRKLLAEATKNLEILFKKYQVYKLIGFFNLLIEKTN